MSSYKTIDGICIREITVERSRFIAAAVHVESEQEAADFIAKKRAEFRLHRVFRVFRMTVSRMAPRVNLFWMWFWAVEFLMFAWL